MNNKSQRIHDFFHSFVVLFYSVQFYDAQTKYSTFLRFLNIKFPNNKKNIYFARRGTIVFYIEFIVYLYYTGTFYEVCSIFEMTKFCVLEFGG